MKFKIVTSEDFQDDFEAIPFIEKFSYKGRTLVTHRAFRNDALTVILHSVSDFNTGREIACGPISSVVERAKTRIDDTFVTEHNFGEYMRIKEFETINF